MRILLAKLRNPNCAFGLNFVYEFFDYCNLKPDNHFFNLPVFIQTGELRRLGLGPLCDELNPFINSGRL